MKYIKYLYFVLCFAVFFTLNASAYLDPSIMTFAVQVIAGIAVAVAAVVGVAFRKAKKKVQNKLGIDENAKKEVEEEIVEFDGEE